MDRCWVYWRVLPASSSIGWDLKSQNCNVLFLAMLLLGISGLVGGRPKRAGFWLALSVSLKLFSVFLIPYAWWIGRRRACAWGFVFLAVFWFVLPGLVFGYPGLIEVYRNWLTQMQRISATGVDLHHPILISLHNSAYWLAAHHGIPSGWTINAVRAAWLALALMAGAQSWRWWPGTDDCFRVLAAVSLLTLAPIALSPYLEPYHAVPVIIPTLLLLQVAGDHQQRIGLRGLAWLLFAMAWRAALYAQPVGAARADGQPVPRVSDWWCAGGGLAASPQGRQGSSPCRRRMP